MTGIYEPLSACLYAAGAVLLTAAAAVFKKNGLYDYYCLMHGKPVKDREPGGAERRPARRDTEAGASRVKDIREKGSAAGSAPGGTPPGKPEGGTKVLDGSSDTTLLGRENGAARKMAEPARGGRIWGKPTGRFRVTKSEVVVHTDRTIRAPADEGRRR